MEYKIKKIIEYLTISLSIFLFMLDFFNKSTINFY